MATSSGKQAPATHTQPSRKGKRAWRKNVDLSEIQIGLESARDQVIQTGGELLVDLPASALFQTDIEGSSQIQLQAQKAHRTLKVDEILARRSAVPSVNTHKRTGDESRITNGVLEPNKRRRGNGVTHAQLQHLKTVAYGGEAVQKDVVLTDSIAAHDPWAVTAPLPVQPTRSFLEYKRPVVEPRTVKHAPISLTSTGKPLRHVPRPLAGRSYNPSFEDWTSLLEREGQKELLAEQSRLEHAAVEEARQDRIAAATAEAEREELRELAAAASEYDESEWEGIQSEVEEKELRRKRPDRKTPVERNKALRKKKAEQLAKHERKMRLRDAQVQQIARIKRDLDIKTSRPMPSNVIAPTKARYPGSVQSSEEDSQEEESGEDLRRRKLGKIKVPNMPLELVLADELQESLRLLKPEGNLLRDRYRNMLVQGRLEARKAITQPKKAKRKATEKWTYKDWTLPGQ